MTVDSFITDSLSLVSAYPTSTTISITYGNEEKKTSKSGKGASNFVKVKAYEPRSGKVVKFKTHKAKEVSRLLTFLGPRGVSIGKRSNDGEEEAGDRKRQRKDGHQPGIASVMSNVKFEETPSVAAPAAAEEAKEIKEEGAEKKSKKKKKKGKK